VPATPPIDEPFVVDRTSELQTALAFHPELLATRDRIKAATTRLKVAENELRPTLNLVMEGYLHSLTGDYAIGESLVDQFSGRPSYGSGLNYERPYRNIVSKAILRERRLELRQLLLDLDNTMLNITAEVDQAIAAVNATYSELEASEKATLAFDAEVRYLEGRWQNAFVESTSPSLLLDELLNAENQLIQSESAWARAQAEHMIAFVKLHVATGMLLNAVPLPPQTE
jgi:outer membrane protein TolC